MWIFHCCHEDSIWAYVQHSSVREGQVHFGLCGSQGVMWWVLCQRMPDVMNIWMRVTLWNGSVMGSLPPARIAPGKGKTQCSVSVRALLPKEFCAAFWTSCYMCVPLWLPHTDTPNSAAPRQCLHLTSLQTSSCWSFRLLQLDCICAR